MEYTIEQFKTDFDSIPLNKKAEFLSKSIDSLNINDTSVLETISELKAELKDLKMDADIEMDAQCISLINEGKAQLYECVSDGYKYKGTYYIYIDKIKDKLLEKWVDSPFVNFIGGMDDLIWIISDNGIGTLKTKTLLDKNEFKQFIKITI